MKYFLIISLFVIISSITSCIPPGKLSEALDANTILYKKYDSLNNKLNDTLASYANSVSLLKTNVKSLNDSVSYYRLLASAPPVLTEGDIFLNQMLGLSLLTKSEIAAVNNAGESNSARNSWLFDFKANLKKYTGNDAEVKLNKGFVFVEVKNEILFNSGSQTLSKKSQQFLKTLAQLLQAQPDLTFMIEGHTDNKAFKKNAANDNWSLSVNRATAVARILQTKYKINPKRIIAAGRSQYVPVDDNKTKAGRLNNRRVRIVIMPTVTQVMNLK
jgi:chemotaxis protein MotB